MKCIDLEALLCDYVDGALAAPEKATVELHLSTCPACRELVEDSRAAVEFMEKAADVEPPPALINTILFEVRNGQSAPVKKTGSKNWIGRLLEPLLQPKFAMGMAMTILSFSMLGRFAGIPIRQLKPSDLEPARIWASLEDKAYHSWDRAKKYYESLRLVYEVQQTLRDWNESDDSGAGKANGGAAAAAPGKNNASALEGPIETKPQGENLGKQQDGRAKQ